MLCRQAELDAITASAVRRKQRNIVPTGTFRLHALHLSHGATVVFALDFDSGWPSAAHYELHITGVIKLPSILSTVGPPYASLTGETPLQAPQ
jgi:hypothetical protein